ncbi:hypothetical protein ACEPPN_018770 [Leptodophora sp. 'Broadleaf-Isolate-01']
MASLSQLETASSAPAEPQPPALTSTSAIDDRDNDSHSGDVNKDTPVADASIHKHSSTIAAADRDYRRDPFWRTPASFPYSRLRNPPPSPTAHPDPTAAVNRGHPDSQYQYFFIVLKQCVCGSAKGKRHHFGECALSTQPLINPFTRKLQPCLNCDSFCHSTYACLEPLKASLITWHAEHIFPSGFGCLEFAKDIYPGQYEITAEEWALLRRGLDPVDERAKGTVKKELQTTQNLPKRIPPPNQGQPFEEFAATAPGSIKSSSTRSQGGTQGGESFDSAAQTPDINTKQSAPQSQGGLKRGILIAPAVRVPSSLDALLSGPNEYTLEALKFLVLPPQPRTLAASAHRYHPQFAQSLHDKILKQKANVPDGRVEQSTSLAAILYPGYVPPTGWASSNTPTGPFPAQTYSGTSGSGLNDLDSRHQFRPEPYEGRRAGPEFHLAYSTQARYLDNRHFVASPYSASPPSQNLVPPPGCGYTSPQVSGFSQGPSTLSYSPAPEEFGPTPPRKHPSPYSQPLPQATFEGPVPRSFAPTTPTQVLNDSEFRKRPRTQLPDNAAPKPKRQRRTGSTKLKTPTKLRELRQAKPGNKLQSLLEESRVEAYSLAESAVTVYQYLEAGVRTSQLQSAQAGGRTAGSTPRQLSNFADHFNPSPHPRAYLWTPAAPAPTPAASSSSAASSRRGSAFLQSSRESSQQPPSQDFASTPATSRGPTPTSRSSQDPPSFLSLLDPALSKNKTLFVRVSGPLYQKVEDTSPKARS